MKDRHRYLVDPVFHDALGAGKMAFISGPRQVGKTTLALQIARKYPDKIYRNWDDVSFRRQWVKEPSSIPTAGPAGACLILDEVHKAKGWKQTLKGIYDVNKELCPIIVTGSAKLDVFRKGGESLLGRYFHFRLHPYSLGEIEGTSRPSPKDLLAYLKNPSAHTAKSALTVQDCLLKFGGFPDPFEAQSERHWRMWSRGKLDKMIREDLRDLSRVLELSRLEMLAALLPDRVGSPLSMKSLAEDLEVSQPTIKHWLKYLEIAFYHFTVTPFSRNMARAVKKEGKIYLWDWSELKEPGAKQENFVAGALLKAVDYWNDLGYGAFSLHLFRDKEKREVDFVITEKQKPWLLVEVKSGREEIHPALAYLSRKWPQAVCVQLVSRPDFYRLVHGIHLISLPNFLQHLP